MSSQRPARPGVNRLQASARRLGRVLRAQAPELGPDAPQPSGEWGQHVDERLRTLEQTVANQNRLLLLTFVTLAADLIAKVAVTR